MANNSLQLMLRIKAMVDGAESLDDVREQIHDLGDEVEQAANPTDDFNAGLRDMDAAGREAGQGIQEAADPLASFKELIGEIAVAALAKQILDLNDQMTALKRGFDVITGGGEATTQALDFVRSVADRLGVGVADLAQSFLKLTAAAKGTQLEGAATEQIFAALAGAMSTVGGSAQDVDNAMNAVAQMMSKGVVSAEELRGQLGDVLPGAAQQAAQSLLATNAEFSKMLESGEVIASEFLPKFAVQLEKALGGGEGKVQSFNASWNRLTNQLADVATGAIGKGFTDFAALTVDKLGVVIRSFSAVHDVIGAAGAAIGGLAAGEPAAAMGDFGQAAADAGAKLFGFKTEAQAAAERTKQMTAELRAQTPEMDRFQDAVARKELQAMPEYLQAAIAGLKKTGDAATAAEQAVSHFMAAPAQNITLDGVLKLATALKAVGTEATQAGQEIGNTLADSLSKLTNEQLTALEQQARKAMAAATDNGNARAAFADLGQIIEATVLARLQRLGVDGPDALTGISAAAGDAMDDFEALATQSELSASAIEKAFQGALAILDSPKELEAFRLRLVELGVTGQLSGETVDAALKKIGARFLELKDAASPAVQALQEAKKTASDYVKAVETLADAQTAGIRAELKLAEAKGQTATAQRLARELAIKEAEASLAVAKAKEAEQIVEFDLAKARLDYVIGLREKNLATQQEVEIAGLSAQAELAQAQAAQTNTAAQTALLDQVRAGTPARAANNETIRDGTAALSDYADISEEAAAAQKELAEATAAAAEKAAQLKAQGELISDVLSGWTDRLSSLSPAARTAFDGFTEGADIANASLEELAQRSSDLGQEIASALTTVAAGGFADWARSTALRALEIEQAFLDQKTAVEQAVEALSAYADGGRLTAEAQQALALKTDDVRNRFSLLNDEDLSKLRQAIDDATARMDELRQASEDALSAAQQALLEEQGDKVGVLQIQQKEKELELQKQINEAKAAGDAEAIRNLQTALDLEQQTYALKIKKAQADATSSSTSTSSKSSGGGEYTLHLKVGSETLNTTAGTDPTSFLRAIENAKRSAA